MKGGDFVNTSQEIAETIKNKASEQKVKLGAMLSDVGVSESTLRNMKNLGCMPSVETLAKIANYLGCSLDELIGTEKNAPADRRSNFKTMIDKLSDQDFEQVEALVKAALALADK